MGTRNTLNDAKRRKADEFYTSYEDIEKEMKYYTHFFKDKTVYCNCDNHDSNFRKYFFDNFDKLGLKRLICTSYPHGTLEDINKDEMQLTVMKGNGDFRSEECIEILKEADIVVTNPPFSLFREFVAQLMEYKKKFLIIGNINAASYKEVFPLIRDNEIWMGASIHSGDREFRVPDDYPLNAAGYRVDDNGVKFIRVKGVRWFTNMDYPQRHEDLILYKTYNPDDYPTYDNYNAINVNFTKEIPRDYDGAIGVPITFLDKYNPKQFEILGMAQRGCHDDFPDIKKYDDYIELKPNGVPTGHSGRKTNENPVLAENDGKKNYYVHPISGHIVQSLYQRIFIKSKLNKEKYE